ncbi:type II toxin-antitoxin system RelE/ParE family toxin [Streptomyces sp. LZ34]
MWRQVGEPNEMTSSPESRIGSAGGLDPSRRRAGARALDGRGPDLEPVGDRRRAPAQWRWRGPRHRRPAPLIWGRHLFPQRATTLGFASRGRHAILVDTGLEAEVQQWLDSLPPADYLRVMKPADFLADHAETLGEPQTRHLGGKLRELRFSLHRREQRITYWLAPARRIVMLTVFHKTPRGRPAVPRNWPTRRPVSPPRLSRSTTKPGWPSKSAAPSTSAAPNWAGPRPNSPAAPE